ncbi:MAG TPA: CPBP family intramembrane glutamic endopeptidase [Candidatus Bathyarchaeia archaeon]|nr:CPBP family intramembrane glutamic endopeptidase [Candidatus Bathyarchaeia archaeon]
MRLSGTPIALKPDDFFKYSTAIAAISVDAVLLVVVLLIARGLPLRDTFALRAPTSWRRALVIGAATLIAAYAISFIEAGLVSGTGREQGVPEFWDPARIGAWAANLFAIAVFVPIFEESLCRGLGYYLFEPLGAPVAVMLTALAFTFAHGVIVDIPVILATGIGLGYLRASTGSIYPCIALHAFFNGFALVIAALVAQG